MHRPFKNKKVTEGYTILIALGKGALGVAHGIQTQPWMKLIGTPLEFAHTVVRAVIGNERDPRPRGQSCLLCELSLRGIESTRVLFALELTRGKRVLELVRPLRVLAHKGRGARGRAEREDDHKDGIRLQMAHNIPVHIAAVREAHSSAVHCQVALVHLVLLDDRN